MRCMGIDVSTKRIAAVCLDGLNLLEVHIIDAKGERAEDRFTDLVRGFDDMLSDECVDLVVVEGVPYAQNVRTTLNLASVVGAVRAVCTLQNVRCETVNTMTWRHAVGAGRTKDDIRAWAGAQGFDHRLQDAVDAYCIARYGGMRV